MLEGPRLDAGPVDEGVDVGLLEPDRVFTEAGRDIESNVNQIGGSTGP